MEHLNAAEREDLLSDSGLLAVGKGCPTLEEEYFDHQSENLALLEAFALRCSHLRTL